MQWSISEMVNAGVFTPLPLCSAPQQTYFQGFLELTECKSTIFKLKHVLGKCSRVSQIGDAGAFKPMSLC